MSSIYSISPLLYVLVPFAFILGSIPFGILFTKSKGINLRNIGSKNIGATNVLRFAGKVPALLTLLSDLLKGAIPVAVCKYIISGLDLSSHPAEFAIHAEHI